MIVEKMKSVVHKVRTKIYTRSKHWKQHPLNVQQPLTDWADLHKGLEALSSKLNFKLVDFHIDPVAYAEFKKCFYPGAFYAVGYKDKKIMEHFIAKELLEFKAGDTYIDVASENSPFPDLFREKLGLDAYSQDLSYPAGASGHHIGSSADAIPLPDRSVDKMSLQCAFEHFQGDADSGFIKETERLLVPGGKCVIVPLYMSRFFLNIIDPVHGFKGKYDKGASKIAEPDLGGEFERYYSVPSLKRILLPDLGLTYTIHRIVIPESIRKNATSHLDRVRYALEITK